MAGGLSPSAKAQRVGDSPAKTQPSRSRTRNNNKGSGAAAQDKKEANKKKPGRKEGKLQRRIPSGGASSTRRSTARKLADELNHTDGKNDRKGRKPTAEKSHSDNSDDSKYDAPAPQTPRKNAAGAAQMIDSDIEDVPPAPQKQRQMTLPPKMPCACGEKAILLVEGIVK